MTISEPFISGLLSNITIVGSTIQDFNGDSSVVFLSADQNSSLSLTSSTFNNVSL